MVLEFKPKQKTIEVKEWNIRCSANTWFIEDSMGHIANKVNLTDKKLTQRICIKMNRNTEELTLEELQAMGY